MCLIQYRLCIPSGKKQGMRYLKPANHCGPPAFKLHNKKQNTAPASTSNKTTQLSSNIQQQTNSKEVVAAAYTAVNN
jgi:hypothetical protein